MTDPSRHAELGHFLRTRRERLAPEEVGLPAGPRRRAKGLRREEVAVLAHLSPTWYAYLEQGRRVRPSAEVLDSLAGTLRLDVTERRYLHALAASPVESVLPTVAPDAESVALVRRFVDATEATDRPVYATDGRGTFLACNTAMKEWYGSLDTAPGHDCNIVWWMFTSPEVRERLQNWADDARDLTARVRYFLGTNRADDEMRRLVDDLRTVSPDFDRWWQSHDVSEQDTRDRCFRHPTLGEQRLSLVVVRPTFNPGISVVFHLPQRAPAPSTPAGPA